MTAPIDRTPDAGAPRPEPVFRWDRVPLSSREWLRTRTGDILGRAYRQACDAVQIGAWLNEARARLKHGLYVEWVSSELPFGVSTARRYRLVADAFAAFQNVQFELFDECALYALAELRVPQPARAHAVLLAGEGRRVTRKLALEILDAHRPTPAPTGKEQAALDRCHRRYGRRTVVEEDKQGVTREKVVNQDALTALRERQDDQRRQKLGWALEEVARDARMIVVHKVDDPEDVFIYNVTCHFPEDDDRGTRVSVSRKLHMALLEIAGRPEMKRCSGCEKVLPANLFSDNDTLPDELSTRCKICERRRKKETKRRTGRPEGGGEP